MNIAKEMDLYNDLFSPLNIITNTLFWVHYICLHIIFTLSNFPQIIKIHILVINICKLINTCKLYIDK